MQEQAHRNCQSTHFDVVLLLGKHAYDRTGKPQRCFRFDYVCMMQQVHYNSVSPCFGFVLFALHVWQKCVHFSLNYLCFDEIDRKRVLLSQMCFAFMITGMCVIICDLCLY